MPRRGTFPPLGSTRPRDPQAMTVLLRRGRDFQFWLVTPSYAVHPARSPGRAALSAGDVGGAVSGLTEKGRWSDPLADLTGIRPHGVDEPTWPGEPLSPGDTIDQMVTSTLGLLL